jgi:hypothetical protein
MRCGNEMNLEAGRFQAVANGCIALQDGGQFLSAVLNVMGPCVATRCY